MPKKGISVSQKDDHPAGLWIDCKLFARANGGTSSDLRKETFEASPRYLELAAVALVPETGRKDSKRTEKAERK